MRIRLTVFLLCAACGLTAELPFLRVEQPHPPPEWALLERQLISAMNEAGVAFVRQYVTSEGELRWKDRYEGGMNSSDDAYEAFRGFSLHTALGGDPELDRLHRFVWEGITRQFTRYGNVYREFDSNWDWMHHGEGYVDFYTLGLVDPDSVLFRDRARRFAAMYTGEDPEAANYDPERKLIRAVMNGSRGPKLEWNTRDWSPTNANLVYYQLPFDDIPGVDSPEGWINEKTFPAIVKVMSDRMAKGDVPINLTAAPLILNAYLYTGEEKYRTWIREYVGAWRERTKANNGIMPDNVGLSGRVGEYLSGNWWGGYYGWRWVRGGLDIVRASFTGGKAAMMLDGDPEWMELARSQFHVMADRGEVRKGIPMMPIRHGKQGWYRFEPEPAAQWVWLWYMSQSEHDAARVERIAQAQAQASQGKNSGGPDAEWYLFLKGKNPGYPARAFRRDLAFVREKMAHILNEQGDPETWFDAKWSSLDPLPTDNLVRLTIGGPPVDLRGEILESRLRYFDPETNRPGLPPDVAALVTAITRDAVEAEFVNLSAGHSRRLIVQAGAYAEHDFTTVSGAGQPLKVDGPYVQLRLEPGSGTKLRFGMKTFIRQPSFAWGWRKEGGK